MAGHALRHLSGRICAIVALGLFGSLGLAAAQPATPESPESQEDYGCVIYRGGPNFNRSLFYTCTLSEPWWFSFSCAQTPVQNGPWSPAQDLPVSSPHVWRPWLNLPSASGDVVVTLWFGSRPMPAGEAAMLHGPHNAADIGITFPVPMESVMLTASEPGAANSLEFSGKRNAYADDPRVWDVDAVNPPSAGCWEFTIVGTPEQGSEVRVPFTFVAVE